MNRFGIIFTDNLGETRRSTCDGTLFSHVFTSAVGSNWVYI